MDVETAAFRPRLLSVLRRVSELASHYPHTRPGRPDLRPEVYYLADGEARQAAELLMDVGIDLLALFEVERESCRAAWADPLLAADLEAVTVRSGIVTFTTTPGGVQSAEEHDDEDVFSGNRQPTPEKHPCCWPKFCAPSCPHYGGAPTCH